MKLRPAIRAGNAKGLRDFLEKKVRYTAEWGGRPTGGGLGVKESGRTDADVMLLSVQQVRRRLQVGKNRVYAMIDAGELPHVKIGSRYKIPLTALERWIERHMKG